MPALRREIQPSQRQAKPAAASPWALWERWVGEVIADFVSVGSLGIGSTLGLMGVVSLPSWFVFRINIDDPHPIPWIRVRLSCAIGAALYHIASGHSCRGSGRACIRRVWHRSRRAS